MLNVAPVATWVPPVAALNHSKVPAEPAAESERVPAPQREAGEVEVMVGIGLMVAKTGSRVGLTQPCTVKAVTK